MYLMQGRSKEALEDYRRAIEINPTSPRAYMNRAAYFMYVEDYQEAAHMYEAVLNIDPAHAQAQHMLDSISTLLEVHEHQQ